VLPPRRAKLGFRQGRIDVEELDDEVVVVVEDDEFTCFRVIVAVAVAMPSKLALIVYAPGATYCVCQSEG
jgi:hypothetical protein